MFFLASTLGICINAIPAFAETTEVVLNLNQKVSMKELAKSVTDPSSPRYRKFYTPAEIKQLVGPSDSAYQALLNQLSSSGIQVVSESATHLSLTVRGERSVLTGIQTQLRSSLFQASALSQVGSVHGLSPSKKRRPHLNFVSPLVTKDGTLPAQIKQDYDLNPIYTSGVSGKGQHIAIATYDGFNIQDVRDYYTKNGLSPGPTVDQVIFNGTPTYDPGSAAETQVDAEFSGMIAPGATIHVFASAQNSDTGELQVFTAILDDNRAKIANYSWGMCETDVAADHKTAMDLLFARAVAQGVNITVASGDSGSDCKGDGSTVADYPAANPNVVAVGGTSLTDVNGVGSETAWSGSGGGISSVYAKPAYQSGLGSAVFARRSYPDVAFNADSQTGQPAWIHYDPSNPSVAPANAQYVVIGGTSIAAPQWAGFLALVGEARGAGKPLGYLNPTIYAIPDADMNKYFNDVTSGSNGAYTAAQGFDAVTGLGSMKGSPLLTYLKNN